MMAFIFQKVNEIIPNNYKVSETLHIEHFTKLILFCS